MTRDELERSWAITRGHLDNARRALTAGDQSNKADISFETYEEYLAHWVTRFLSPFQGFEIIIVSCPGACAPGY